MWVLWLSLVSFIGTVADHWLPNSNLAFANPTSVQSSFLYRTIKWDGILWREIASLGYHKPALATFFPLYPVVTKLLASVVPHLDVAWVGLAVSAISLLGSLLVLYQLFNLDVDGSTATQALWYLLLFPTALFFALMYSESLFLLLSALTFFFLRKQRWFWCGVFGMLAALTRPVGVLLFIPAVIELVSAYRMRRPFSLSSLWLLLIPFGLIVYMAYLQWHFGNPWLFLEAQKVYNRFSSQYLRTLLDSLTLVRGLFFSGVLVAGVVIYRRIRRSYGIYVLIQLLPPLLSGSLTSINRYAVVLFPIPLLMAVVLQRRVLRILAYIISAGSLIFYISRYVNGYWVG